MAQAEILTKAVATAGGMIPWHLGDFTEADMLVRPVENANHTAWQLCHLAGTNLWATGALGGTPPANLPAKFESARAKGASTLDDADAFPSKAEILSLLAATQAAMLDALAGKSDADLAQPGPESMRSIVPTLGEFVGMMQTHAAMHLGQIQVIRRKLGKPNLF